MTLSKLHHFRLFLDRAWHVIHQVARLDLDGTDRAVVLRLAPVAFTEGQERVQSNLLYAVTELAVDHHSHVVELYEHVDVAEQCVPALLEDVAEKLEHEESIFTFAEVAINQPLGKVFRDEYPCMFVVA